MKHGFKCRRELVLLILLTMIVTLAKAQPGLAFYAFDDHFNSSSYNPAFLTSPEKFTLSIFPMAGTSLGYNNPAVFNKLVPKFISGVTTNDDYREVLKNMVDWSYFHQNLESSLLSFTYHSKIGFFNFRIKENEYFSAAFDGELSRFLMKTSIQSVVLGQSQNLFAQAIHYREYSLGYSFKSSTDRFYAGIQAKMYFGKSAFYSGFSGSIQGTTSGYDLKTSGIVNISIPDSYLTSDGEVTRVSFSGKSNTMDYLLNSGNTGFGVDLGIKYKVTPDLTFSMSVIDLGKINWKSNVNSRNLEGNQPLPATNITKTTNAQGLDIITKGSGSDTYSDHIEHLDNVPDSASFSRTLPVNFYMGIKYQLNPGLTVSFTDRYLMLKGLNYNSFSASANIDINKKLTISAGYSIIGNSYTNIPVALLYNANFGQIYLGTDNLTSILLPSISEFAGISFGTCFYLSRKRNLYGEPSEELPFYRPRKKRNIQKNGLLLKLFPDS
jgi:hypothetical protein